MPFRYRYACAVAVMFLAGTPLRANPAEPAQARGCIWSVTGKWHLADQPALTAGELIAPGALISADAAAPGSASQSVLILMPDGQRLSLDCADEARCSRGFRLPALTGPVDADTIAVFEQVAAMRRRAHADVPSTWQSQRLVHPSNLLRFESAGALGQDGLVDVTDAVHALPPGRYRLVIRGMGTVQQRDIPWNTSGQLRLSLRSGTLYQLQFYGTLNVERMRGSLLVAPPGRFEDIDARLDTVRSQLEAWNELSPGWPIDDFLFLYLETLENTSGLS